MNTFNTDTPDNATVWKRLVAAFQTAAAIRESTTGSDGLDNANDQAAFDAANNAAYDALKALCRFPSPTLAALAEKCELISGEYPDGAHLDGCDAAYIIADVRQLVAREGQTTATKTSPTPSPIILMHTRYEANMAEYAVTEKAEYAARKARADDACALQRALQTSSREADALRTAILYQVPDTKAEAAILQYHITNAYDMIAAADDAPGDDGIALGVAIDTLFDFMCCEIQQDHSEIGPSFSDGAIRVLFARRLRTGVVEG